MRSLGRATDTSRSTNSGQCAHPPSTRGGPPADSRGAGGAQPAAATGLSNGLYSVGRIVLSYRVLASAALVIGRVSAPRLCVLPPRELARPLNAGGDRSGLPFRLLGDEDMRPTALSLNLLLAITLLAGGALVACGEEEPTKKSTDGAKDGDDEKKDAGKGGKDAGKDAGKPDEDEEEDEDEPECTGRETQACDDCEEDDCVQTCSNGTFGRCKPKPSLSGRWRGA